MNEHHPVEDCCSFALGDNASSAKAEPGGYPKTTVHHPSHYGGDTTYEAIKVIEAWDLNFHLGNALKYIKRADAKDDPLENLEKARWYIDREIVRRISG